MTKFEKIVLALIILNNLLFSIWTIQTKKDIERMDEIITELSERIIELEQR